MDGLILTTNMATEITTEVLDGVVVKSVRQLQLTQNTKYTIPLKVRLLYGDLSTWRMDCRQETFIRSLACHLCSHLHCVLLVHNGAGKGAEDKDGNTAGMWVFFSFCQILNPRFNRALIDSGQVKHLDRLHFQSWWVSRLACILIFIINTGSSSASMTYFCELTCV